MTQQPDTTTDAADAAAVPAAPGSLLASIRDRREKAKEQLFLDLPVPRYDPPLYVRFKQLEHATLMAGEKQIEAGRKDPETVVRVNAGYLARACVGLFEVIDGEKVSIDPENRTTNPADWVTFGPELAEMLGETLTRKGGTAGAVRALYLTDGDVIATAGEIASWSGYTGEKLDEAFEGN